MSGQNQDNRIPRFKVVTRIDELTAIKARREGVAKISRVEVASEIGMSVYKIHAWANNNLALLEEIAALCEYFNCRPGDLFELVANEAGGETPKEEAYQLAI